MARDNDATLKCNDDDGDDLFKKLIVDLQFYSKKSKAFIDNTDTYIAMFREIMYVYNTVMRINPLSL